MSHMLDLIKQSAVPANIVRAASKGALTLPPNEILEILVYLTTNPVFGEQARMTLAGWDENTCMLVLSDPATPYEVLNYFLSPQNRRPKLLPALLENTSVREAALMELAQVDSREILTIMLASKRVCHSPDLLQALVSHPHITPQDQQQIEDALRELGTATSVIEAMIEEPAAAGEEEKSEYEIEHAAAIAAEEAEGKAFELVGGHEDDVLAQPEVAAPSEEPPALEAPAAAPENPQADVPAAAAAVKPAEAIDERTRKMREAEAATRERITTLQKIGRLTVGQRIQLAMKGNKSERYILVRDGSKLVSQAVLQSPKLTDLEVENFAAMKNVQEGVLREIARNPKFKKNYGVIRALVNNPRTPMDLGLTLINHVLVNDLKALSTNKNIGDTIRKVAFKRYKEKTEKKKGN